jgi:hypothetical protein
MKIVKDKISLEELKKMADKIFGDFVKAVVDVEKKLMVVDAGLHADQEALLLKQNSKQENLWGINLYPDEVGKDWIKFNSLINLRPNQGNQSRGVDNPKTRKIIIKIVNQLVKR